MSNIEFNGIQIEAEEVRRKLEEHDTRSRPRWPVFVADLEIFEEGRRTMDGALAIVVTEFGKISCVGSNNPNYNYFAARPQIREYLAKLLEATAKEEVIPAVPAEIQDYVGFGQMPYTLDGQWHEFK